MPDTYVACAMSSFPKGDYEQFREILLAVCDSLDTTGRQSYRAPFETSAGFHDPAEALLHNLSALEAASLFVLVYTHKEATSSLIELGYALKRQIPILVFAKHGATLPFYLRDAAAVAHHNITIVPFEHEEDLPLIVWQALK